MAYDIFISYRRKGAGSGVAGELQAKLENRGYKVFLDVDEMTSGPFPIQIDRAIESCKDFLLVLAPGTLDRCVEEDDWVRREIVEAESLGKNLIGIMLPGFVMPEPEDMPEPLRSLPTKQVFLWSHEYRTASFEKIEENLISAQLKKRKGRKKRMVLMPLLIIVLVLSVVLLTKKQKMDSIVESEIVDTTSFVFNSHVEKAGRLMEGLPTPSEFDESFLSFIENEDSFQNLMSAIMEYDAALVLKNEYPDQIMDTVGIEKLQTEALELRSAYLNRIIDDIGDLLREGGEKFAVQDIKIAKILAMPDDERVLDSLDQMVSGSV